MPRPALEEVAAQIATKGYHFTAEAFIAYYTANGWRVGKNPMKDWRAACVSWEQRWLAEYAPPPPPATEEGVIKRRWAREDAQGGANVR